MSPVLKLRKKQSTQRFHAKLYITLQCEKQKVFSFLSPPGRTADGTYVNKRLLELDVKSVIGKGNDGVLSTAHILCALSMQFKERNLQGEEKPFRALSSKAKSLNTAQVNGLHPLSLQRAHRWVRDLKRTGVHPQDSKHLLIHI